MLSIGPERITQRGVLRALVAGFALVVALLGWAGFVAVRGTHAIEMDAAQVGREQLAMARLLNDIQAGQNTLAAVMHQLAPGKDSYNREQLLKDLESADRALSNLAVNGLNSPEQATWRQLDTAVKQFSRGVNAAVRRGGALQTSELLPLLELHDHVVESEQRLLIASERRMEETERHIELESRDLAETSRMILGACFVLSLLCALFTLKFARASIRKIEHQASELSRVSWHMLQDQESMARRFAHELHDELGQSLAAIKANLTASGDLSARREDCIALVGDAIANVREISQLLHPVILDDFGLDAALRWLTDGFAQRTGVNMLYACTFTTRTDSGKETHLFRIAQEALTNVARHSRATAVRVELHLVEPLLLQLSIEDNGQGLTEDDTLKRTSIGLTGMRARAEEIHSEIRFIKPDNGGLRIEVDVPLPAPEESHEYEKDTNPARG